uniref:Uncharacterized protein n=1 Tax=Phasianus colchicus TaxID=9054 RepID=A0A669PKV3_PHACC
VFSSFFFFFFFFPVNGQFSFPPSDGVIVLSVPEVVLLENGSSTNVSISLRAPLLLKWC